MPRAAVSMVLKMLNGEFQDTTFQIGFTANDTATLSIEDVRPQGLGEYVMTTSNSDVADVVIGASVATRTYSLAELPLRPYNEAPILRFRQLRRRVIHSQ